MRLRSHIGLRVGLYIGSPSDDSESSTTESDLVNLINGNAGTVPIGTPVYSSAADTIDKARANAAGTSLVIGVVTASVLPGASVDVATSGAIVATTGQWDTVAGTTGGLVFNTIYYLDASSPGKLTSTAPSGAGQFVVQVGVAVSTTTLVVSREPPIGPL